MHLEVEFSEWGWKRTENSITPIWTTLPEASKACRELVKYSCKVKFSTRCQCKKAELSCTELCLCSGGCATS